MKKELEYSQVPNIDNFFSHLQLTTKIFKSECMCVGVGVHARTCVRVCEITDR